MTNAEKTVPVPVSLLQQIKDRYPVASNFDHIAELIALIPSPPKVGDTLTAKQIADLPDASVMSDDDDDVLVKVGDTVRRITMDLRFWDEATRWATDDLDILVSEYTVTLVFLPRD